MLDRLLDKGLISRRVDANDRRSLFVALTSEGDSVFRATFPDVTGHCDGAFAALSDEELKQITATLAGLRLAITAKLES
ncbi:HTH-type transcriptional regulator MhqR [compost metagenome]